jgi:hypothetical protein
MEDFVVDKVSWHTAVKGNPETLEHIRDRFWEVIQFLQIQKLAVRHLASSIDDINNEFEIRRSDLTELGFKLVQAAYDKWLRKLDKGMPPSNV